MNLFSIIFSCTNSTPSYRSFLRSNVEIHDSLSELIEDTRRVFAVATSDHFPSVSCFVNKESVPVPFWHLVIKHVTKVTRWNSSSHQPGWKGTILLSVSVSFCFLKLRVDPELLQPKNQVSGFSWPFEKCSSFSFSLIAGWKVKFKCDDWPWILFFCKQKHSLFTNMICMGK